MFLFCILTVLLENNGGRYKLACFLIFSLFRLRYYCYYYHHEIMDFNSRCHKNLMRLLSPDCRSCILKVLYILNTISLERSLNAF